jgi:hypothetical protein
LAHPRRRCIGTAGPRRGRLRRRYRAPAGDRKGRNRRGTPPPREGSRPG